MLLNPMEKIKNYIYFDGNKNFEVTDYSFKGSLTGDDYVYRNAHVMVSGITIKLLENRKSLHNFQDRFFTLEQLEVMADHFNMDLVKDELSFSLTIKGHWHGFDIVEDDNLIIIYSLEGTKAPEYMFLYGVWKKNKN